MPKRKSVKQFNKKHNTLKRFKGGNTVKTTCDKYKDKIVRGTPKNWAYKKCIKRDKSRITIWKLEME